MADKFGLGQADKRSAEDRTAQVAAEDREQQPSREGRAQDDEPRSAAAKVLQAPESAALDPFPAYDLMTLDQLRDLAASRNVQINRDVEKAHLITELRAADTQTG